MLVLFLHWNLASAALEFIWAEVPCCRGSVPMARYLLDYIVVQVFSTSPNQPLGQRHTLYGAANNWLLSAAIPVGGGPRLHLGGHLREVPSKYCWRPASLFIGQSPRAFKRPAAAGHFGGEQGAAVPCGGYLQATSICLYRIIAATPPPPVYLNHL